MEQLNQLVEVINRMKEVKKNSSETNNQQELFYTITLLKEIFGQEINSGILREMMRDVRKYLFEPSLTISVGERNENGKFGISFEGELQKGIIVANYDENGNLYRGDIKLFKKSMYEWRPDNRTHYQFSNGVCTKDTPAQTTEMYFDENGLEISRKITKYDSTAKTQTGIISKMNIERDSAVFNVVHVNVKEHNASERSFDAQIADKLYSLVTAEEWHTYSMSDDVSDMAYESIGYELAYKYFPELEGIINVRMQGVTKSR